MDSNGSTTQAILQKVMSDPLHPYFPVGVVIPGLIAKELPTPTILAIFTATCTAILLPSLLVVRRSRPGIPTSELATALWFVLCGFIHLGLEGYFAYNAHQMGSRTDILGQLWKEYSLSDSRYLTRDTFVVCMETITAVFWGPLSFAIAYGIASDSPWRHPLQLIVSLGQLYGDVLYYATCIFEEMVRGVTYSRPEPAIFWGYFVFMNVFWIVIPLLLLKQSVQETTKAFAAARGLHNRGSAVDEKQLPEKATK